MKTSAQEKTNEKLENFRQQIDSLDRELIQLLGKREKVVKEVGIFKAQNNIAPLQQKRFDKVLEKAISLGNKEELSAEFITEIMNAIHKESLRIEKQ